MEEQYAQEPKRSKANRDELVACIADAVEARISNLTVPEDVHSKHHDYIDALIEKERNKEERRQQIRQAIVDKSISALLWSGTIAAFGWIGSLFKDHWK